MLKRFKHSRFDKNNIFLIYLVAGLLSLNLIINNIPPSNTSIVNARLVDEMTAPKSNPTSTQKQNTSIIQEANSKKNVQNGKLIEDECNPGENNNGGCGNNSKCSFSGGAYRCINKETSKPTAKPQNPYEQFACTNDIDCEDGYYCNKSTKPYLCKKKAEEKDCQNGKVVINNNHQWCYREKGDEPICLDCKVSQKLTPSPTVTKKQNSYNISPTIHPTKTAQSNQFPYLLNTPTPTQNSYLSSTPTLTPKISTVPSQTPSNSFPSTSPQSNPTTVYSYPTNEPIPTSYINPTIPTVTPFTTTYCQLGTSKCESGYLVVCSYSSGTYYYSKSNRLCDNYNSPTPFFNIPTQTPYQATVYEGEFCNNIMNNECTCDTGSSEKVIQNGEKCEKQKVFLSTSQTCTEQWCECKYQYGPGGIFNSSVLIGKNQVCEKNYFCSQGILEGLSCLLLPPIK